MNRRYGMPKTARAGMTSASPGTIERGPATWVELRDGTRVHLPVIIINGREDGPKVVLCGATHPTELSGTATIYALAKRLDPSELRGSIIAFPIANPLAMQFGSYISPHDGVNLNVAYPGSKTGSITSRIADFIWNEATFGSSLAIDLHENVNPCLMFSLVGISKDNNLETQTLRLAEAFGVTVIRTGPVDFATPGTKPGDLTWAELCMANGIPGFTVELEGRFDSRFDENQSVVRIGVKGVMNTLRSLGMIQGDIDPQTETPVLKGQFAAKGSVRANRSGLVNRLVDTGVKLRKGKEIAEIIDPYGQAIETVEMPFDGYIWAWTIAGPNGPNWCVQSGSPLAYLFSET